MEAFLNELRKHLNGKISPSDIDKAINDYRDYINGELSKGRSFDDILNELGDPKLLAKSIVVANITFNSQEEYTEENTSEIDEDTQTYTGKRSLKDKIFNTIKNILILVIIVLVIMGFAHIALYIALAVIVIPIIYGLIKSDKD